MADLPAKIADPLQFLTEKPLCAYPSIQELILGLKLDDKQREKLLVELHRFEHALLADGFELYSAVSSGNWCEGAGRCRRHDRQGISKVETKKRIAVRRGPDNPQDVGAVCEPLEARDAMRAENL